MKLKDHDSNIKISLDTDNGGAVQLVIPVGIVSIEPWRQKIRQTLVHID